MIKLSPEMVYEKEREEGVGILERNFVSTSRNIVALPG